ncbi:hypothetical protein [Bradyrhizobium sp. BR 1432]|uniref:hypothetical protein n=1 Tax=Bradyrhizobium sp. BR 1432 TaxID=3447966 RepID=UPI003EE6A3F2
MADASSDAPGGGFQLPRGGRNGLDHLPYGCFGFARQPSDVGLTLIGSSLVLFDLSLKLRLHLLTSSQLEDFYRFGHIAELIFSSKAGKTTAKRPSPS